MQFGYGFCTMECYGGKNKIPGRSKEGIYYDYMLI
jgi:hypothetical protein